MVQNGILPFYDPQFVIWKSTYDTKATFLGWLATMIVFQSNFVTQKYVFIFVSSFSFLLDYSITQVSSVTFLCYKLTCALCFHFIK